VKLDKIDEAKLSMGAKRQLTLNSQRSGLETTRVVDPLDERLWEDEKEFLIEYR